MLALVWNGPNSMTLEEVENPAPTAGNVVVRVAATGICGSDITAYVGKMGVSKPGQIRGHEFSGTVALTAAEDARWSGAPVAVNPLVSCGICDFCLAGADNLCATQQSLGILRPGSFAEFVSVPVRNLVALPATTSLVAAAATEPLAQAIHDVRLAQRDGGVSSMLIIGAGAIGYLAVQAANQLGVDRIDVLEPNPTRHESAREAGASAVFGDAGQVLATSRELSGGGYDAVLELVGTGTTRRDAVVWTRRGGTTVFIGLHEDGGDIAWRDAIRREITVRCSNASTAAEFALAADWISAGLAGFRGIGEPHPLGVAPQVFQSLASGAAAPLKTMLAGR